MSSSSLSAGRAPAAQAAAGLTEADAAELAAYREWIPRVRAVCVAASQGDLEPRLLHVEGVAAFEDLAITLGALNSMLDLTDAFVRESSAALGYAARDKYFRRVLEQGTLGSFRRGAGSINQAMDHLSEKNDDLLRLRRRQLELADEFESTIQQVVRDVAGDAERMQRTAQTLSTAAEQAMLQADGVADSVHAASDNLGAISRSSDELSQAVTEISQRLAGVFDVTREAVRESADATERAATLSESSGRIGSVVHLIRQVAQQTNLLALNATIEAVRAGDAGRGFAVVASEVKDLSAETGRATEEIERQVGQIESGASSMVGSIESVSQVLGRLDEVSSEIAAAMEEQDAVTSEVTRNTRTAAASARDVLRTIQGVREASADTARSSTEVLSSSDRLSESSGVLSQAVDRFLTELRSAG